MKPYYEHAGITIYHGDCREVQSLGFAADACVSDPPYGMGWNTDTTRFSGGIGRNPSRRGGGVANLDGIVGDDAEFDPHPWVSLPKVIFWGWNHFALTVPVGTTLVWLKRFDDAFGTFLSDAELAWMKGGSGVYCHRDLSMNSIAANRLHPCEKPVGLMKWCISKLGETKCIIDPFCGSGTTLIAAKELGIPAIGIEIEEKYCEIAAKRLSQEVFQF